MELAKQIFYGKRIDKECPICLNNVRERNYVVLPCKHKLHKNCLEKLKKSKTECSKKCPLCRADMDGKKEENPKDFFVETSCGLCNERMRVTESSCQYMKHHGCFFHYNCVKKARMQGNSANCNCGNMFTLDQPDMISYLWFINGYEEIVGNIKECKEQNCSIIGNPKRWGYCSVHNSSICTNMAFAKALQVMARYVDEESEPLRENIFYKVLARLMSMNISIYDDVENLRYMIS